MPAFAKPLQRGQPFVIKYPESDFAIPKMPLTVPLEPVPPFPLKAFGEDLAVFVPMVHSPSDFVVLYYFAQSILCSTSSVKLPRMSGIVRTFQSRLTLSCI